MKKRIIATTTALLIGMNIAAFGQEITPGITEGQTTVTYHADADYCVLIPDVVVADGTQYRFTASIMDLCGNERVDISVSGTEMDGSIQMFSELGKWMLARMYTASGKTIESGQTIASFRHGMTETVDTFYILPELSEGAGNYTGSITFDINLVQE